MTFSTAVLRPLSHGDLQRLHEWHNSAELRNAIQSFRYPLTLETESAWLVRRANEGAPQTAIFAIQQPSDNDEEALATIRGIAQLQNIDPVHRRAELGIFIGDEGARGGGLATKAMKELIAFAQDDLNLRRITLFVDEENSAATKLYEKHGFVEEGRLKQHYFSAGRYLDVIVMGLIMQLTQPLDA